MPLPTLGIDRAIGITILNRAWSVAAGPATLVLIVACLSPVEQGFYYAFTSVLGLQVFFELGLGFVVMQTVSHIVAGLEGNAPAAAASARARLGRLLADVLLWYGIACVAFIAIVLAIGAWILGRAPSSETVAWQMPWLLVVPAFGLSILANACFSFLEGMGLVADVALARLAQIVLGFGAMWIALLLDAKLMALVALHAVNLLVSATWLFAAQSPRLRQLLAERGPRGSFSWREEIWPFHWRIAASWLAGYFGSQAITLMVFARLGPVEGGRFGLTFTALSAAAAAATAWFTTKAPRFGVMVAQGRLDELDALFLTARRDSLVVGCIGLLGLFAVVAGLSGMGHPAATRFVSIGALAVMAAGMLASINIAAEASYLRAFRREPYLAISVTTGVLQASLASAIVLFAGVDEVALAYGAISVLVAVFWAHPLYLRLRTVYRVALP